jgi:hypothetical protein
MCVPSRHFGRNPATRAPMRCALGGASKGDRGPLSRRSKVDLIVLLFVRTPRKPWGRHRPPCVRRRFAGRRPVLTGISSSWHRCRNWSGRLSIRTQQPTGSNTGARSWPWSGLEIRWRQCRGCACYTYHSDARPNLLKLSESLAETTRLFLHLKPAVPPNRQAFKPQALER